MQTTLLRVNETTLCDPQFMRIARVDHSPEYGLKRLWIGFVDSNDPPIEVPDRFRPSVFTAIGGSMETIREATQGK